MDIRSAILAAADWIEKNPSSYEFQRIQKPSICGSPGCLLGYIGLYAKSNEKESHTISKEILGIRSGEFYARMDNLLRNEPWRVPGWEDNAVRGLRLYADKYHPAKPSIERKPGAEVCREIMARPFKESANA